MQNFISMLVSISVLLNLFFSGIQYTFKPVIEVDASASEGAVTTRATGFLYGLAEDGVPSKNMTESLDISSVSQKVMGGLQHPIGDVDHVASNLDSCDYIVVYLQDAYDTWYYDYENINSMRESGEYNWKTYIQEDFFPRLREKVTALSSKDYSDRLVYCLYNECDNGVWFDSWWDGNGKENFFEGWKMAYEEVKKINPSALIGGPGYYEYNIEKIGDFLSYCKKNDCLPDIMIYHELYETSSTFWQDHVEEYRECEKNLGINELPIIVTEYGCMDECGVPGEMLHYVAAMEKTGVYGNVAYWRLANNLCDTAADSNMPNSNWWLYRMYADMEGSRLSSKIIDMMHSDFANTFKYRRDRIHYTQLDGFASINDGKDEISVILGGCDYTSTVAIKNINKTNLGGNVTVKVEAVYYKGLSGAVTAPVIVSEYSARVTAGKLKIQVPCNDSSSVYRVTVSKGQTDENYHNSYLPQRFEFEKGTLLGGAYHYDSAYGTTGEIQGMTGGIENEGDGVSLDFTVPDTDKYNLNIIFGNSNDGSKPADRKNTKAYCKIDGVEYEISFPNTIKSEYTDNYIIPVELTAGTHNITFTHGEGTFVLDSLLVEKEQEDIYVIYDSDRSKNGATAFLAVVPDDGCYEISAASGLNFKIESAEGVTDSDGNAEVFLQRGLNYIEFSGETELSVKKSADSLVISEISASEMSLTDGAVLNENYIDGISSEGGSASFTINADAPCTAAVTFLYSNNAEGGVHSYNVDLIEQYITLEVNGEKQNVWCRNTCSFDTYKTVTAYVKLAEGENVITLSNSGDYLFNNAASSCPRIASVTISKAVNG